MIKHMRGWAALALAALLLLAACGDGDAEPGITADEVREIVRAELAAAPAPPQPGGGVTAAEAERIARGVVASIPSRSAPADYAAFVVDAAIARYETRGREDTLAHYSRKESIDGQWYVFIIDQDARVVAHPDPERVGLDVNGWVGTDINGYNYAPEMLSATDEGKWVTYVSANPEHGDFGPGYTGEFELKNAWVVRHDGLLFGSGWYVNADAFTQALVATAARVFRQVGLEGTIAYFASPDTDFAGLHAAIAYYNTAEDVAGAWFAFVADESGTIIDHFHKEMVGKSLADVLGTDDFEVTVEGNWITTEDVRVWVLGQDGMTFGSGWHSGNDEPGD